MTDTNTQAATQTPATDRKTSRRAFKKKLMVKIKTDKEFAKTYFAAKSKRSTDKKSAFQKKKNRKKA